MGTSQEATEEARSAEQKRPEVDIMSPRLFFNSDSLGERPWVQKMPVAAGPLLSV